MSDYTIKVSQKTIDMIFAALSAGPYRTVAPVIADIEKQVKEQQKKKPKEGERDR